MMNVKKSLFLALAIPAIALASALPLSAPVPGETGYASLQSAALAGLSACVQKTQSMEVAGAVYLYDGKFYYTNPAGNEITDHFNIQIMFPKGATLVGLFHIHPANFPYNYLFSADDVTVAKQLRVTSFLGVLSTSSYHVISYTPGQTSTIGYGMITNNSMDNFTKISYGTPVTSMKLEEHK